MSRINRRQNFATQLVKAPKDQYKVLFESTPVALVEGIWGSSFKVLHVNRAAMELFSADSADQFTRGFNDLLGKINPERLLELLSSRVKGDLFEGEIKLPTLRGKNIYVFMRLVYMPAAYAHEPQHAILAFHDITEFKKRENFFMRLSQVDGLTRVLNHRTIIRRLENEILRARRYDLGLACVLFDLDNFKNVNDTFGHLAGDKVLKDAAHLLKKCLRETDIVGRYGGDEFLVVLPETGSVQAIVPVTRFLQSYAAQNSITRDNRTLTPSFSVGISGFPADGIETAEAMIAAADKALYESKSGGGNCYHIHTQTD